MSIDSILVIGGRGGIGTAVTHALTQYTVHTCDRHPGDETHIQADITQPADVNAAVSGHDAVINLVGLSPLRQPHGTSYEAVHVGGVRNVVTACEEQNVQRLVHISALGADPQSALRYLRTKGEGETIVHNSALHTTVFRPSVVLYPTNELVQMAQNLSWTRLFPHIPAQVQPIIREDVAQLITSAIKGKVQEDILDIGGPDIYTIFELGQALYRAQNKACYGIPLPLVKTGMHAAALFSLFGLSSEQIAYVKKDNVPQENAAQTYATLTAVPEWLSTITQPQ